MSFKIFMLLVCFASCLFFVHAQYEGKKCIEKQTYNDGCNNCFCATNKQNAEGVWEPIIACTKMACLNEDGSVKKPQDPPAYFWEQ